MISYHVNVSTFLPVFKESYHDFTEDISDNNFCNIITYHDHHTLMQVSHSLVIPLFRFLYRSYLKC